MSSEQEVVKRGKKALPPLPCGCDGSTGQGKTSAMLMTDGTRVCRAHGKRWRLTWVELPSETLQTGEALLT